MPTFVIVSEILTIYWSKIAVFTDLSLAEKPSQEVLVRTAWKLVPKNKSPYATQRWKLHDPTVNSFDALPACDGRTDGHAAQPMSRTQRDIKKIKETQLDSMNI